MENEVFELFTTNESNQVKSRYGGSGRDNISSIILADILARGNSHTINGEGGSDALHANIWAHTRTADSATVIDNTTSASGGSNGDYLIADLWANASGGGTASVIGNSVFLEGGDGNDSLNGRILSDANGGEAVCKDNLMILDGGDGADELRVSLDVYSFEPDSISTVSGNRIFMYGGEGNDRLDFSAYEEADDRTVIDGGAGYDVAYLSYQAYTGGVAVDLRGGYDRVLPDGVTLVGIESVAVYGGSGDDRFWGGDGDDRLDGYLGSDRVHGGGGADTLNNDIYVFLEGDTELESNEHDWMWGGEGDDFLSTENGVRASLGGRGTVTQNTSHLYGGQGDDTLEGSMEAKASGRSRATLTDNLISLRGGEGADLLSAELVAGPWFGGVVTFMDNRIDLGGGSGDDVLGLVSNSLLALSDNRITLDGGRGADTFVLDRRDTGEDFNFAFSDGYDQRLTGGTRLAGFEEARIYAGMGDDTFQGGYGNDTFDGGEGRDVVILDGLRSDYDVTCLDDRRLQARTFAKARPTEPIFTPTSSIWISAKSTSPIWPDISL